MNAVLDSWVCVVRVLVLFVLNTKKLSYIFENKNTSLLPPSCSFS